jgi:hypothetical protein
MPPKKPPAEDDISFLMGAANCDRPIAIKVLEIKNNDVNVALDYMFDPANANAIRKMAPAPPKEDLWPKYSAGLGFMSLDNIGKFYRDCLIDVEGNAIPVMICCIMKPKQECSWTKEEFERLLKEIGVYDAHGLGKKFRELEKQWLSNDDRIKQLWEYLQATLRDYQGQGRCPAKDVYVTYMRIMLTKYHYSNELASFMEDHVTRHKIFPELWQETLIFLKDIKKDFPNFNSHGNFFILMRNRSLACGAF